MKTNVNLPRSLPRRFALFSLNSIPMLIEKQPEKKKIKIPNFLGKFGCNCRTGLTHGASCVL